MTINGIKAQSGQTGRLTLTWCEVSRTSEYVELQIGEEDSPVKGVPFVISLTAPQALQLARELLEVTVPDAHPQSP